MSKKLLKGISFISILLITTVPVAGADEKESATKFSGYTFIETGEVMKGQGKLESYDHRWMESACIGIFSSTRIDEHLMVLAGFEALLGYPFNVYAEQGPANVAFRKTINSFWVSRGEGLYTFGDTANTSLQIEAGYFPYKYNNEVRNLGEYLFRTYCYPPVMINQFDRTFTELLGFRIGNTLSGILHHDLIFYSETKLYPYNDFSLAYLADLKIPKVGTIPQFITLGGGINLYRLIPVRGDLTTPKKIALPYNLYQYDTVSTYYDSLTQSTVPVIDDKWYSYAGTKVMGRATIDFKGVLPEAVTYLLGPEDLKLYGEVAVLGWKNYPNVLPGGDLALNYGYEKRYQRTPFTVGFNIPTFKILDLLNTEIEYLNSPYYNSIVGPFFKMSPIPTSDVYEHERLKWSVYLKKTIGQRMIISAQVANDHIMPKSLSDDQSFCDYTDVTLRHGDWWWNLRVRFDF